MRGMVDTHCHVLPAIDDGARTMEESLEFCRMARRDGVEVTVATPHVKEGSWENTPEQIREGVGRLREALDEEGIEHRVEVGGEVHLRMDLADLVAQDLVPTFADGGRYLLLELPRVLPDYVAEEAVESLRGQGITAVIAHVERCDTLVNKPVLLHRLVRAGALSQITAGSLDGTFGSSAKNAARFFLEHDLVHLIASDAHSTRRRRPVLARGRKLAAGVIGEDAARRLVVDNPWAVVEGREVDRPPPREPEGKPGGFLSRLFGG